MTEDTTIRFRLNGEERDTSHRSRCSPCRPAPREYCLHSGQDRMPDRPLRIMSRSDERSCREFLSAHGLADRRRGHHFGRGACRLARRTHRARSARGGSRLSMRLLRAGFYGRADGFIPASAGCLRGRNMRGAWRQSVALHRLYLDPAQRRACAAASAEHSM